jgi:type IX secretion system PorP/SprF family membrane protein
MKTKITYILLCLIIKSAAQDVHFSQYYFSPLSLNPANTGNDKADFRFFGNYRSQWRDISKAYNTFSAGGDFNIYPKNINLSGGLIFINDNSGGNLNVNKILPSFAIHKKISGFKLHAGVQPGVVIKTIDFYSNSFPSQFNIKKGRFDNTLINSENNVGQRFTFLDVNAGLGISRRINKLEPEIGFAAFHLNSPTDNFLSSKKNKLPIRQMVNMGLNYFITNIVTLKFYSMYGFTTKASDWVSGINLEYQYSKTSFFNNIVFAGFMWRDGFNRSADAGIVTAGFAYLHYTVGFSYDITYSELKTSVDRKGAYEIAFIYRSKSTRINKKIIACERY